MNEISKKHLNGRGKHDLAEAIRCSASVSMELLVNDISIPVAQMGPDFLLVAESIDHPPANATIVMQVDASVRQWVVHLPNRISSESKRVVISVLI